MANVLGLGVFGTFGQPYLFQQAFNAECQFAHTLDLDSSEIDMFPGTELFAVRREVVKGIYSVAFCMYTFTREMNANRNTTFLGSCIVLQGIYVEAEKIYKLLRELHTDLVENTQNVNNNTIQARQVVNLAVREPAQFQSIKFAAKSIDDTPYYSTSAEAGKRFFVTTEHIESASQVITFFDEALKNYNDTDSLYFTFSDKIINDANKKGKLGILNWDQFIEHKNLVKEDFTTSKPAFRVGSPETTELPAANNYYSAPPAEAPVAPASAPPPPQQRPATPPPPAEPENVISDPDFAFDGWNDPSGTWDADEVTRRVNEYNRLRTYAKQLKTRNEDFLNQKLKQPISESITETHEEPEVQQQKQPAWSEIPVNSTTTQRKGSKSDRDDDDDGYFEPFYKRKPFIIVAVIVLLLVCVGGYIGAKKHIFSRQGQQTEDATENVDTGSVVKRLPDTTKPPEHPDVRDSNVHQ